jgi:hypothetical protein
MTAFPKDDPDLRCPDCNRRVRRKGSMKLDPNDKRPASLLADGTCTPCWVKRKGLNSKEFHDGKRRNRGNNVYKRPPMTDEQIAQERQRIKMMEVSRLMRGIPEEGIPVEDWARGNGGLYSFQIPGRSAGSSTGSSRPA